MKERKLMNKTQLPIFIKKCQIFLVLLLFFLSFSATGNLNAKKKFICGYKGVVEYINSLIRKDRLSILHHIQNPQKEWSTKDKEELTVTLMMYRLLPINENKKAKCRFFSYLCVQQNNLSDAQNVLYDSAGKYLKKYPDGPVACHIYSQGKEKTFPLSGEECQKAVKKRVRAVPVPLAVTQAGLESAWGTSYFAKKGYNFFGVQTRFASSRETKNNPKCIPARRFTSKCVYKFTSLETSFFIYAQLLNTGRAYLSLRQKRYQSELAGDMPCEISHKTAGGLKKYATDPNYVKKVRHNIQKICQILKNC